LSDYGVSGKHGKGKEKAKGVSNYHPKCHTVLWFMNKKACSNDNVTQEKNHSFHVV